MPTYLAARIVIASLCLIAFGFGIAALRSGAPVLLEPLIDEFGWVMERYARFSDAYMHVERVCILLR